MEWTKFPLFVIAVDGFVSSSFLQLASVSSANATINTFFILIFLCVVCIYIY